MDYCGPRALPHSQFLRWSRDDQDKAIAWMQHTQAKCPNCGTFPEDWLTSEGRMKIPPPFEAHDRTCYGCQQIGRYNKYLEKEGGEAAGRIVVLLPADPNEYNPEFWTD